MANFDAQGRELFKCGQCHKRQIADCYELDRHGHRRKGCNECKAKRDARRCPHGCQQRNSCKDCRGASICEHNRMRHRCKECGGVGICEHKRDRTQCKDCGGSSICEHNRTRNHCKECGGSGICEHNRIRHHCKDCGGASICEHNRERRVCKDCGGGSICEHKRNRQQCKLCDPAGHLRSIVSCRIHNALKSDKGKGSLEYLGCSIETLREHLEQQFEPGMCWENHGTGEGKWQIDHIVPIKYPGKDGGGPTLEEVAERLHWTNCQPMWASENIAKGNRFIGRAGAAAPPALEPEPVAPKLTDDEIDELLAGLTL